MMRPIEILERVMQLRSNPVQLVKHIDEVPQYKLRWPAWGEVKHDGVWFGMLVSQGETIGISRTGKVYQNTDLIGSEQLMRVGASRHPGLYIGELVNPGMSLEELSGCVNPNRKTPLSHEMHLKMLASDVIFHDYVTIADFIKGMCVDGFRVRRNTLRVLAPPLNVIEGKYIYSREEFDEFADEVIKGGGEGAVLKQLNDYWEAGHKGSRVTKAVRGLHVDLICTAVKYGKGKREGLIAALAFQYKGNHFWADLGKGWDDSARKGMTESHENGHGPIGKMFHVYGLQESSKGVIRLPKVAEQRFDKEVPDA